MNVFTLEPNNKYVLKFDEIDEAYFYLSKLHSANNAILPLTALVPSFDSFWYKKENSEVVQEYRVLRNAHRELQRMTNFGENNLFHQIENQTVENLTASEKILLLSCKKRILGVFLNKDAYTVDADDLVVGEGIYFPAKEDTVTESKAKLNFLHEKVIEFYESTRITGGVGTECQSMIYFEGRKIGLLLVKKAFFDNIEKKDKDYFLNNGTLLSIEEARSEGFRIHG